MKRKQRRHRVRNAHNPEVSLTPLIDTVLVLLVIFMIATPIMNNMINIELPSSSTNDETLTKESDKSVVVFIDKDQNLFINDTKVIKEQFFDVLEKKLKDSQERVVFVKADKSIPYGTVIQVVDDIKYLGGVEYVALAAQDLQPQAPA